MTTLLVRPARAKDVEALLAIQRAACVAAFAHIYPPELYPFPDDAIRAAWREAVDAPGVDAFVAELGGEPVGSVSVGGELLQTLYVLPEHWKGGVGTTLHDHALESLRARGAERARLWTLEENWDGRRFYERRGWTLNAETRIVPFEPHPIDVQYERPL